MDLDSFVDLFNEAVLKVRVFIDHASIKHNTVVEGYIFADVAILADDGFVDIGIVLDFAVLADVDVVGECSAVCYFGAFPYEFVELADSEDFVLRVFLKLNESLIIVHRIGIQIPADKVHIGKVNVGGLVESEGCFGVLYLISVYLLLVHLRSQHADYEVLHSGVLKIFLE